MAEKILVCVAWPYANGHLHLGHVAGAYLPADIFARYHRLRGADVLMVSGSDQHGTPITIKAEQENVDPTVVADRYHQSFLQSWEQLGITFDNFTTTGTENHARVAGNIFKTLLDKGYIYKDIMTQPYCEKCARFLPDRYLEGVCPHCGSASARGDQCDVCGHPMNTTELGSPRCIICDSPPDFRRSEHFFLKLSAFEDDLLKWVKAQPDWRPQVRNFTISYLEGGLHDRAITRDITWGVPLPVEGYDDKRIYVWFEAVIGYLSSSIEWAQKIGQPEKWREFWQGDAKSYYFVGKDNIPFHTIIWPSMLKGSGDLNLPTNVPANEYLTIEGRKLSTSKNWAVWVPDFLTRYDPDPLRFILSINMPESGDTDFSWREFVRRNNDELVATWGNLANRVLTFVYKNFDGKVPESGEIDDVSAALQAKADKTFTEVGDLLAGCRFKQAIKQVMALAQETNRYLDEKSPWKVIKEDREAAATSLFVALGIIADLKTMFYPFLPYSSQKLHEYLGFTDDAGNTGWQSRRPEPGQPLQKPLPLFVKLDEEIVAEETARMGQ
jgi:methionyl-tRNA synthetase